MAIGETLTNIAASRINKISDIKLSANWMAPAGHPGEDAKLYETVKAVGREARAELETFLDRRVHLFLTVKVRPGWLDEAERYSEMGLDFSDGSA